MESNPVWAEMVASPLPYPWSSVRSHAGLIAAPGWPVTNVSQDHDPPPQWKQVPNPDFQPSGHFDRLREATRTDRPFGTGNFLTERKAKLDRTLFQQKPRPKPKEASQAVPSGARMEIGSERD